MPELKRLFTLNRATDGIGPITVSTYSNGDDTATVSPTATPSLRASSMPTMAPGASPGTVASDDSCGSMFSRMSETRDSSARSIPRTTIPSEPPVALDDRLGVRERRDRHDLGNFPDLLRQPVEVPERLVPVAEQDDVRVDAR